MFFCFKFFRAYNKKFSIFFTIKVIIKFICKSSYCIEFFFNSKFLIFELNFDLPEVIIKIFSLFKILGKCFFINKLLIVLEELKKL